MIYPAWLILADHVVVWAVAITATVFVATYAYVAPWHRSPGGRAAMEVPASLALLADLNVIAYLHPRIPLWYVELYVGAVGLVSIALLRLIILLVRLQLDSRRNPQDLERK